jgi:raffinose/stachyose/melibiose transport system substrate-binding protein
MGLMPFPIGGNDKLAVSVPTVWAVNGQAKPEEIKAAKDFLSWLYDTEAGQKIMVEDFGFIPVVEGAPSGSLDPLSAEVSRYVVEGKTLPWATNLYPAGIVDVHLVPVAERFFSSAMTEEELLLALDEAWANAVK